MYIYEQSEWPQFKWDTVKLLTLLTKVRNLQGRVVGKMSALGFELKDQANLEILTQDVLKSTEIEGELLDPGQVRSSVARRLGLDISGLVSSDRNVDGVVEMMIDATECFDKLLDKDRLFAWQSALFPSGYSGIFKVLTGKWRDDSKGPMQVISGPMGKEKVHYQAPDASSLEIEMKIFLEWLNNDQDIDPVIMAAITHLWFVTLHPFEDGNGRIARAISDMQLARSDNQSQRFYSMSTQIRKERKQYYDILEQTQKGTLDITNWLEWFLHCLLHALESSETILEKVIFKHNFWVSNASTIINERQKKLLNRLLDGFEGKLTSSKWANIAKCSQDTATRDIQDLIDKKILYKLPGGGRSTGYDLL
ncbi:MAG: Fic family protein [Candidatus Marinimicrobia bacterium]|nr:Fic family protein [Candidatus Neomarinimicrobiota bacterium]